MGRQRQEFTPEYNDEAVRLVTNTGHPVVVVARELGVKAQTLGSNAVSGWWWRTGFGSSVVSNFR